MDMEPEDDLVIRSSGDFLADQGIADPDEFRVKSHLGHEIAIIAEQRGLATADVARLAGEPPSTGNLWDAGSLL
jgi:hypothetical protein